MTHTQKLQVAESFMSWNEFRCDATLRSNRWRFVAMDLLAVEYLDMTC